MYRQAGGRFNNTQPKQTSVQALENHGIIELLRLEKICEFIKSSCQPCNSTKPHPSVSYPRVFLSISRDDDFTTSLGSLFKSLIILPVKKFFLISNLNLRWHKLRLFALILWVVP